MRSGASVPDPRTSTSMPASVAVTWMSSGFSVSLSASAMAQAAVIAPESAGERIGHSSIATMWWARGAAPGLPLYLAMGWLGVMFAAPIAGALSAAWLAWLLAGAAVYTAGTLFYVNDKRWPHAHGIWHLFVMGGTACHFVTVFGFLRLSPA